MSNDQPGRPSILANLILMLIVGMGLFAFLTFTRGCGGGHDKGLLPKSETTEKPKEEEKTEDPVVAAIGRKNGPVPKAEPVDDTPKKPAASSTSTIVVPPTAKPPVAVPVAEPVGGGDMPSPAAEPVREVAANSAEGGAMLKDAIARIDEAPDDLYPERAKAKVRAGLQGARRIFKVDTIYFEKGGAKPLARDKEHLVKALQDAALQEASADPRAVFFVLGFADTTGNPDTNKKLSYDRATAVIDLLEGEAGVLNLIYPVAVGPTEIVSPENQQKNRAAEVWLVLP